MRRARSATILSMGAVMFLWTNLSFAESPHGTVWGRQSARTGRGWVQFRAYVLYAGATVSNSRGSSSSRFYRLNHRLGQLIIVMPTEMPEIPWHQLWLKGDDQLFTTLAAEELLFKEIEISGLLREYQLTTGILELVSIQVAR